MTSTGIVLLMVAHAKERYQNVHNMVKKTMYKGHKYQEALES